MSVDELYRAERVILQAIQQKDIPLCCSLLKDSAYPVDNSQARQRHKAIKKDTNLYRLDPYIGSDGLVRVDGRIRRANIPREMAHPIILPVSHVTRLLVEHYHRKTSHSRAATTLNEVRATGYWILRGRTLVNSVIHNCVTCRKLRFLPEPQIMSDLPQDHLEPVPPFTYAGVDYFGPFYIKEGRSQRKRWGCLFTCLVTRAVHIETANSLSTDSFINAYRRFIGRRGPVRILCSDCGTNFVGAKSEMEAGLPEMNHGHIRGELLKDNCNWVEFNMNVPHASHMGGVWERMIHSARAALASLLDQHASSLDDELLRTLMMEAEAIVNSRPLTCTDADSMPLTPAQLLTMKSKTVMPPL